MILLSDASALEWCGSKSILLSVRGGVPAVEFGDGAGFHSRLTIPMAPTDAVGLAYLLLLTDVTANQESAFEGALVWLRRWEIWSESIDSAGYVLLDGLRRGVGPESDLHSFPGQAFQGDEFRRAHACLSIPILFQWDAYLVPASGGLVAFVSHEGHIDLWARHASLLKATEERIHNWNPAIVRQPTATKL